MGTFTDSTYSKLENFNPLPGGNYHWNNDYILMEAARIAYNGNDKCVKILKEWGFKNVKTFRHSKGDFAYLAGTDTFIFMVFRGTNDVRDVPTDLTTDRVRFLGSKSRRVHKGFSDAFYRLWNGKRMEAAFKRMRNKGQKIFIAGHSLGGAMAAVAAAHLLLDGDSPVRSTDIAGLLTIGQPRVFNKKLREKVCGIESFNKRYHRYTNHQDMVVAIPPKKIFGKVYFDHGGTALDFGKSGGLKNSTQSERDVVKNKSVGDHSSDKYAARMLKNRTKKISV